MNDLITASMLDGYIIDELKRDKFTHKELMIVFRYGIKVCKEQPGKEECKEKYLDKAIAVINRLRK